MDAKELIKKIRAAYDGFVNPIPVPAPAPAPVELAAPVTLTTVDGKTLIADKVEVGGIVTIDGAPAPDGDYQIQDGSTISITAGSITAVTPAAAPAAAAAPVPAGPTLPQFEAMQKEVNDLKAENAKFKILAEKHEAVLPDLLTLADILVKASTAEPKALNDRQKEKFEKIKERDDRIAQMAANLKEIQNA